MAANITATLDEAAGSSVFAVNDSGAVEQAHIDSDGNGVLKGCLRLDASGAECTVTEGLIVDGNVGIGNTAAGSPLAVGSSSQLTVSAAGNLATSGTINTTNASAYLIGGSTVLNNTGTRNILVGVGAGASVTGTDTVAVGYQAGNNASFSGAGNVFLGMQAGFYTTTGTRSVFVGQYAGYGDATNKQTGADNIAIGYNTAAALSSGTRNTIVGGDAGETMTTATDNTVLGYKASRLTTGSGNTAVGVQAGENTSSGGSNTFIGYQAGNTNTTGTRNSYLGYQADGAAGTSTSIAIGYGALATANNQLVIGANSNSITTGYIGNGVTNASPAAFTLNATGGSGTNIAGANFTLAAGAATGNAAGGDILFQTSDAGSSGTTAETLTTKMAVKAGGNVGIGTTAPTKKFVVTGGRSQFNDYVTISGGGIFELDTGSLMYITEDAAFFGYDGVNNVGLFYSTTDQNMGIYNTRTSSTNYESLRLGWASNVAIVGTQKGSGGGTARDLSFVTGGTEYARITSAGNVGIATTAPVQKLQVAGDIRIGTGTTGCVEDADGTVIAGTCSSDIRLKRNVEPFTNVLDKVAQLQPVTFRWNAQSFPERHFGDQIELGLIAQDVEKVFPELVSEDTHGFKTLHYEKLPFYLLESVRELYGYVKGTTPLPALSSSELQGRPTSAASSANEKGLLISSDEAVAIPAKGQGAIYVKDGSLYFKNDQDKEWNLTGGGGMGAPPLAGPIGIGATEKLSTLTVQPANVTKIAGTTSARKTTMIQGSGTHFLSELGTGDSISLSSSSDNYATVTAINSDTSLTVDKPLGTGSIQTIQKKAGIFRLDDGAGAPQVMVSNDGSLGIGTVAPAAKLHLDGGSARISSGENYVELNAGGVESISDAPYAIRSKADDLSLSAGKNLSLGSGNQENRLFLNKDGYVGIGTTDPTAMVHINGAQGPITLEVNSNERIAKNTVFLINSDVAGNDKGIFRVLASGSTYADGPYQGSGADYAEWFEKEGELTAQDIVGLNLETGKVRKYKPGDMIVGVYSANPGFVGNNPSAKTEADMMKGHALVSLVGQVDVDGAQVNVKGREVMTADGVRIGYRLANGKVLLKIK